MNLNNTCCICLTKLKFLSNTLFDGQGKASCHNNYCSQQVDWVILFNKPYAPYYSVREFQGAERLLFYTTKEFLDYINENYFKNKTTNS